MVVYELSWWSDIDEWGKEYYLVRDTPVDNFHALVKEVAESVAENTVVRGINERILTPCWGNVMKGVAEVLCSEHGFRPMQTEGVFHLPWSSESFECSHQQASK